MQREEISNYKQVLHAYSFACTLLPDFSTVPLLLPVVDPLLVETKAGHLTEKRNQPLVTVLVPPTIL